MLSTAVETVYSVSDDETAKLLHRRFGHLSYSTLRGVDKVTTGLDLAVERLTDYCVRCILVKAVKVINRTQLERTS
jgi:hypothetical protein